MRVITSLRATVLVLGVVASLSVPVGADAADGTVFTFEGGGWGHSVGMSQYGAYGMSKEGYSYDGIITHFFSGSSVVDLAPSLASKPLWVNVATADRLGSVSLRVVSVGPGSVPVTFSSDAGSFEALVGETVVVEALGSGQCSVTGPGGSITGPCMVDADWDGSEASPTTAVRIPGCATCTYARGGLRIRPHTSGGRFNVTLEIAVEDYILGIAEMPYSWGTPANGGMAALEAQAVAARSYAVRTAYDRGNPDNRTSCWCQLSATTADQVYVGYGFGWQTWIDAVRNTAGKVVSHPSQPSGIPVKTFYSSSTYGWTENYEDGFGGSTAVPFLRAVDDHWSANPDLNPNARWTRQFTGAELASALEGRPGVPSLPTVSAVEISKCSVSGAALEITFRGGGSEATVTTRALRSYLGLRSMQVYNVGSPPPAVPPCPGAVGSPGGGLACNAIAYDPSNPRHAIYPGAFPVDGDGTVIVDLRGSPGPMVVFWDGVYSGSTRIHGTPRDDVICGADNEGGHSDWVHGHGGSDVILGGGSDDTLIGGSGADTVFGDTGSDELRGGRGDDEVDGGPGRDTVRGGPGDDMLFGRGESDVMRGGGGRDVIDGGNGSDTLAGGRDNDTLYANAGDGNLLLGGPGNDRLEAGTGNDDQLRGRRGHDTLIGGSGDGTLLYGDHGNDTLTGGSGNGHRLYGGPGDDTLTEGTGSGHILDGGAGHNTLVYV